MSQLSRRDFLKIAGAGVGSLAARPLFSLNTKNAGRPNIIIILCDSFSARHLSLYGYPRQTTPHMDSFAENATVYHNHYSGGNYTTTGTASMLTGMIPWKHRAINLGGLVKPEYVGTNPYTLLGSEYRRFAFSQNPWPNRLMGQYQKDIDLFLPSSAYSLRSDQTPLRLFENDRTLASIALEDFLFPIQDNTVAGTALLGYLNKHRILSHPASEKMTYRHGVPEVMESWGMVSFLNEEVYSGVHTELAQLNSASSPYFAYFHLYSPHFPYRPRNDFQKLFQDDGYTPVSKPVHPLSSGIDGAYLNSQNALYDRQVAQVDYEFGRLLAKLEEAGILENSYLILTSDHGELFERGFMTHGDVFMYEPVVHIPLIIRAPGQIKREDIYSLTSNIDILPTILSIARKAPAPDVDGQILPGFGGSADEDRPVFSMYAGENPAFGPIKKAVISMHKKNYKLIAYLGYDGFDHVYELYDLANDPDELKDLSAKDPATLKSMKEELFVRMDQAEHS